MKFLSVVDVSDIYHSISQKARSFQKGLLSLPRTLSAHLESCSPMAKHCSLRQISTSTGHSAASSSDFLSRAHFTRIDWFRERTALLWTKRLYGCTGDAVRQLVVFRLHHREREAERADSSEHLCCGADASASGRNIRNSPSGYGASQSH